MSAPSDAKRPQSGCPQSSAGMSGTGNEPQRPSKPGLKCLLCGRWIRQGAQKSERNADQLLNQICQACWTKTPAGKADTARRKREQRAIRKTKEQQTQS